MGRSIRFSDYDMRMQSGLPILLHDISCERQYLHLFVDGDLLILLEAGSASKEVLAP